MMTAATRMSKPRDLARLLLSRLAGCGRFLHSSSPLKPQPSFLLISRPTRRDAGASDKELLMLLGIALVLLILWVLGFFAFHVAGSLIHLVLVVAIVVGLIHLFQGRRA